MMAVSGAGRHSVPTYRDCWRAGLRTRAHKLTDAHLLVKFGTNPNKPACNEVSGSVRLSERVIIGTFSNQICGLGV